MLYEGKLEAFFEQGSEYIYPTFWRDADGKETKPYDRLIMIEEGDYLMVLRHNGAVLWQGTIVKGERPINWAWVQKSVNNKKWLQMFSDAKRAVLIKK